MKQVYYKKGYKYQLAKTYSVQTNIKPWVDIHTEYISLTKNGTLTIKKGYASDGPSGLTIDTSNFMRAAFVHDAFYQLMRHNHLNSSIYRKRADKLLQQMCVEDGMSKVRAWYVYHGVRIGGKGAASSENIKKILIAPRKKGEV